MPKGRALLVGLKEVDPNAYYDWNGQAGCWGCENDVDNMEKILKPINYEVTTLKTKQATKSALLVELKKASNELRSGDIFIFYFSGHGGQQPDRTKPDEFDGKDETILLYDGEFVDDTLDNVWKSFKIGVRLLMISDSCNSGTNYKGIRDIYTTSPIVQFRIPTYGEKTYREKSFSYLKIRDNLRLSMDAQMIHFGGCRDGFNAEGLRYGGVFTLALVDVWDKGTFQGSYEEFYYAILNTIRSNQRPQYNEYGPVTDIFRQQRPFTI